MFPLVREVVIYFPAGSVLSAGRCGEDSSSQVQVLECAIDAANSLVSVRLAVQSVPVALSNQTLAVRTRGGAVSWTGTSFDAKTMRVAYYSWDAAGATPAVDALSVTDASSLLARYTPATSALALTADGGAFETFSVPHERYIDEMLHFATATHYAPVRFDLRLPVATAQLSGASFHQLVVQFPWNVQLQANAAAYTDDVLRYKADCQLEGRYRPCALSNASGFVRATLSFQDAFALNASVHVRISQLDPFAYPTLDGFAWATNSSLGQFVVALSVSGDANSYTVVSETQAMHLVTKSSAQDNYLRALTAAYVSNSLRAQKNLVLLQFQAFINEVDYLVVEIDTLRQDGTPLYSTGSMFGLQSGQQFPCAVDEALLTTKASSQLACVFEAGSVTEFGRRMRISVTNFNYVVSNASAPQTLGLYLLLQNPDVGTGQPLNVALKLFGGTPAGQHLTG